MKKKTKIIISCIVAAVVILGIVIWVILPRAALSIEAKKYIMPCFESKGEYFDGYDVRNDSFKRVENENVSLTIPSGFEVFENEYIPFFYKCNDTGETVYMHSEPNDAVLDMTDYEPYADDASEKDFQRMIKAFESFGNGMPDSRFASYKCTVLLDEEDYCFWDLGKATVFNIVGMGRAYAFSNCKYLYVYESENVNGIIEIRENTYDESQPEYEAIFEAYPVSNLNHSYTLYIDMNSLEDIYSVINSVEFKTEG